VRLGGLWVHREFLKVWAGQTVSLIGSAVTGLALPLTAVLVLGATPAQMGLLGAFQGAPVLLLGLVAGVWVDRLPRRPVLIATDLGLAVLIGSIPLAATLGLLRMEWLYVVGFLSTSLTFTAGLAAIAFLPALVGRERLVEGNAKLSLSGSVAQALGPSLAGGIVQVASAPLALVIDAASYLVSAATLWRVRVDEGQPRAAVRRPMWAEVREGFGLVLGDPVLRALQLTASMGNLFTSTAMVVYVLYVTTELGISPATLGLIYGAGSLGGLLGATGVGPCTSRFGVGRTMMGVSILYGVAALLVPLAAGPPPVVVAILLVARFVNGIGNPIFNVTTISLRQATAPDHLHGRVNASARFIAAGSLPMGALLGGLLGEAVGLRPTLFVAGVGVLLAGGWLWTAPVRSSGAPPTGAVAPAE
jgi:MFS family permease